MVTLPTVPDVDPTFTAQQSRVSSQEISNVGRAEGDTLDALNNDVVTAATPAAQAEGALAGQQMVTRDANGNTQIVEQPHPLVAGRLGEIERQSTLMAYQVSLTSEAQTYLQQLAAKTMLPAAQGGGDGDPAWFKNQADAYVKGIASNQRGGFQATALQQGNEIAGQFYRNLLGQKSQIDAANQKTVFTSQIDQLRTDISDMASQGGTNTPEFAQKVQQLNALRSQMAADPRMGYPVQKAQIDSNLDADAFSEQAVIGQARRRYDQTGNLLEAQRSAEQALNKVPMDPARRLQLLGEVNKHLAARDAYRGQAVSELNATAGAYTQTLQNTHQEDPVQTAELVDKLTQMKSFKQAADVQAVAQSVRMYPAISAGTADDAANAMKSTYSAAKAGTAGPASNPKFSADVEDAIQQAARANGVDPGVMRRFVAVESGGNPNDVTGSYKGLGNLSQSEFDQYKTNPNGNIMDAHDNANALAAKMSADSAAFKAKFDRDPTATDLYLIHNQGMGGYSVHLANPNAPAWQNMAGTTEGHQKGAAWAQQTIWGNMTDAERAQFPGGVTTVKSSDFINMWRNTIGDASASPLPSDATRHLIQLNQTAYNARSQNLWDGMKQAWSRPDGQPSSQNISDMTKLYPYISDQKLAGEIQERMTSETEASKISKYPLADQQAISQMLHVQESQGAADRVTRETLARLDQMTEREKTLGQTDPVTLAQIKQPTNAAPNAPQIKPLDLSTPANLTAGIQARQTAVGALRQQDPSVAATPLSVADRTQVANAIKTLPGQNVAPLLGALTTSLSPEEAQGVFKDEGMKNAVIGLTTSGDPAKMAAGYGFLGSLEKKSPMTGVEQMFDKGTYQRMRVWQTKTSFEPADQAAKEMAAYNDPSATGAMEEIKTASEKELKAISPATILGKVSNQWSPSAPVSTELGSMPEALTSEFNSAYLDYRQAGLNPDGATARAAEQVGKSWGPSAANNGAVMKYPPESVLKDPKTGQPQTIDGSFDWMKTQLTSDISHALGFEKTPLRVLDDASPATGCRRRIRTIKSWRTTLPRTPRRHLPIARPWQRITLYRITRRRQTSPTAGRRPTSS